MTTKLLLLLILIGLIIYYLYKNHEENLGGLVQLSAKGPEDTYLTGVSENYYPDYYPYYYNYRPYYYRLYPYPLRPRKHYRKRYGFYLF
jgi:hypothetical protein